jgi:ArsR family transcriptional regulator
VAAIDPHLAHYEFMADVFKSLGHPMRLRILELLAASDEVSVGEFLDDLGAEPSHLSHQLTALRRQRLIAAERHGNQVSYRLTAPEVVDVLKLGRVMLGGMVTRAGDIVRAASDQSAAPSATPTPSPLDPARSTSVA